MPLSNSMPWAMYSGLGRHQKCTPRKFLAPVNKRDKFGMDLIFFGNVGVVTFVQLLCFADLLLFAGTGMFQSTGKAERFTRQAQ